MADQAQDRHLPPTDRKLKKARADGQVARSRDLGHVAALCGGIALLAAFAPELSGWLRGLLTDGLRFDAAVVARPEAMAERLSALGLKSLAALLPLGAVIALLAVAASVLSGGWNFTMKPVMPKLSKLDPLAGLQRLVSLQHLGDTAKASLLALLLGGVGALFLWRQWPRMAELVAMPLPAGLAAGGALLQGGLVLLGAVLLVAALVDVPWQRRMLQRQLRMSVQELKQEMKEADGSGEIKSKMRQRMRELGSRRMLAAVPQADLVVLNPTHYAVALKYDDTAMAAPRVVAKGADLLALKIRDTATAAGVPVLQAPPLARALYAHCAVDQEVPARLFGAVAQVLAWVYQVREATRRGRAAGAAAPTPEVPPDMDPLSAASTATASRADA